MKLHPALQPAACLFLPAAAAVLLAACGAGYHASEMESAPWNDAAAERAARLREKGVDPESTSAIEKELLVSEKGRVLLRLLRLHGGWERWLALERLRYSRTRSLPEKEGQQPPPAVQQFDYPTDPFAWTCPCGEEPHAVHFAARPSREESPGTPEVAKEYFLLGMPFLLLSPDGIVHYRGVEEDVETGRLYEKMRWSPADPNRSTWALLYFDRSDHLFKRALLSDDDGRLTVLEFADWTVAGGLKFPLRRKIYRLRNLYSTWDPAQPVAEEVLTDFEAQVREEDGASAPPEAGQ
jgi:hypothetical protein